MHGGVNSRRGSLDGTPVYMWHVVRDEKGKERYKLTHKGTNKTEVVLLSLWGTTQNGKQKDGVDTQG
jgi:hypothetical protein